MIKKIAMAGDVVAFCRNHDISTSNKRRGVAPMVDANADRLHPKTTDSPPAEILYNRVMDRVSPDVRSRMMAAVRCKNTSLERLVFSEMRRRGIKFKRHYKNLPGTPDVALPGAKKAIFIDGDFWHGYRYPAWKNKIKSEFWRVKLETNRRRDKRNFSRLRKLGWRVLRVWEHDIKKNPAKAFQQIYDFVSR